MGALENKLLNWGPKLIGPLSILATDTRHSKTNNWMTEGEGTGLAQPKRQKRHNAQWPRQQVQWTHRSGTSQRATFPARTGDPSDISTLLGAQRDEGRKFCDSIECPEAAVTYSEGGGLVLAHTTDLRRPFLCQPCPALQLLSASEIPRERRITVGLSPLNLSRRRSRHGGSEMESTVICFPAPHLESHVACKWAF